MVTDNDAIARNTKEGWNSFCRVLTVAAGAVVIALSLMAIFLL